MRILRKMDRASSTSVETTEGVYVLCVERCCTVESELMVSYCSVIATGEMKG